MMDDKCFNCGEAGHFASSCPQIRGARPDDQPKPLIKICRKCGRPLNGRIRHTDQELNECAWRGGPCDNCGHPPHPDNWPGRCHRYTHPGDTPEDQQRRTRWTAEAFQPGGRLNPLIIA